VGPYVTISCGIAAIFPNAGNQPKELIEKADQGLYLAKQKGRDCVVVFEDPEAC
jgi:PleD family two-component response regulator